MKNSFLKKYEGIIGLIFLFFVLPWLVIVGGGSIIKSLGLSQILFYLSVFIFIIVPILASAFYLISFIAVSDKTAGIPRWVRIIGIIIVLISFSFFSWVISQLFFLR